MKRNQRQVVYIGVRTHVVLSNCYTRMVQRVFCRRIFICSIGNPEPQYEGTRHNVGNYLMESIINHWKLHLKPEGPNTWRLNKYPIVLFKSTNSYMNLLGSPVVSSLKKSREKEMLVLHDELQRSPGKYQIRQAGTSNRGHNGLKSIEKYLGTSNYSKVLIGIGRPTDDDVVSWVMSKFHDDELHQIDRIVPTIISELEKRYCVI